MSHHHAYFSALLSALILISLVPQNLRAQTISPTQGKPYTESIPGTDVHFEMVPIPGGTFTMGSPPDEKGRRDDEAPQFRVRIEPFYMEQHEVTWPEYMAFAKTFDKIFRDRWKVPPIPRDKLADAVTFPTPRYDMEWWPALARMGGDGPGLPAGCKHVTLRGSAIYKMAEQTHGAFLPPSHRS